MCDNEYMKRVGDISSPFPSCFAILGIKFNCNPLKCVDFGKVFRAKGYTRDYR